MGMRAQGGWKAGTGHYHSPLRAVRNHFENFPMSDLTPELASDSEGKPDPPRTAEAQAKNSAEADSAETGARQDDTPRIDDFSQLPGYARSLLRIDVPVSVRLASKKESVQEIIELAPGSIIKFDKACDQPLHLYVGDQEVAAGEAVKIGDCFGFRLSQLLMPKEHFHPVLRPKAS
jgi:flagellar motor switch protein FliN/FliY